MRNLLFAMLALVLGIFISSCSKKNNNTNPTQAPNTKNTTGVFNEIGRLEYINTDLGISSPRYVSNVPFTVYLDTVNWRMSVVITTNEPIFLKEWEAPISVNRISYHEFGDFYSAENADSYADWFIHINDYKKGEKKDLVEAVYNYKNGPRQHWISLSNRN